MVFERTGAEGAADGEEDAGVEEGVEAGEAPTTTLWPATETVKDWPEAVGAELEAGAVADPAVGWEGAAALEAPTPNAGVIKTAAASIRIDTKMACATARDLGLILRGGTNNSALSLWIGGFKSPGRPRPPLRAARNVRAPRSRP